MTSFEVNPWFNYYVLRDGRRSALYEAIHVGRETMTTPGGPCPKACGNQLWFRPLVNDYTCYSCSPGEFADGVERHNRTAAAR